MSRTDKKLATDKLAESETVKDEQLACVYQMLKGTKSLFDIIKKPDPLLTWPEGPKCVSQRGHLLMKLGLQYIEERYGHDLPNSLEKETSANAAPPMEMPPPARTNVDAFDDVYDNL